MSVRRLLVSSIALSAVAAAALVGCGAPPSERAASSGEAVTASQCGQIPFTHFQCTYIGGGGGSGGGGSGSGSGGIKLQSVQSGTSLHEEAVACTCAAEEYGTSLAAGSTAVSCYKQTGVLVPVAPPPALAGCTEGVVMSGVDYNGMVYANTWLCPSSYVGQIPSNLGAAPSCGSDPYTLGLEVSPVAPGETQCEWVYTGTELNWASDCMGQPHPGWIIVQERVFGTTLQPLPPGRRIIGLACHGGCCVPDDNGDGGAPPPPYGD